MEMEQVVTEMEIEKVKTKGLRTGEIKVMN